jgi:hypothetical protein
MQQRGVTDEECDARSRRTLELNLARYLQTGYHGHRWTDAEMALLGMIPDAEVARQVNRTVDAVRQKRQELGLPNAGRRAR